MGWAPLTSARQREAPRQPPATRAGHDDGSMSAGEGLPSLRPIVCATRSNLHRPAPSCNSLAVPGAPDAKTEAGTPMSSRVWHAPRLATEVAATLAKSACADWRRTDAGRFRRGRRSFNCQPLTLAAQPVVVADRRVLVFLQPVKQSPATCLPERAPCF